VSTSDDTLSVAIARHQIELADEQVARLDRYCQLLWAWNEKLNLTRHDTHDKFVSRDLVDSLAFAEFLQPGETVLDVGTGGGVPGVILAIVRPDLKISLSDSVGKKAKAVAEIVGALDLNVPVYSSRAEEILNDVPFNTLVIRAVARLEKLLRWFRPHWDRCDRLLVLKGPGWVEERGEARHLGLLRNLALRKLKSYPLPGTESESVLLQICLQERLTDKVTCRLTDLKEKTKRRR
jgi:16S rRNA (guanine527-N7)-methyltransferase